MRKAYIFLFLTCILVLFSSCSPTEIPPEINLNTIPQSSVFNTDTSNDENDTLLPDDNYIVSEILTNSQNNFIGPRLFGDNISLECNGNIYLLYQNIKLLNPETGCIQSLCSDPLCDHQNSSCINTLSINAMLSYDGKIYCKGKGEISSIFGISGGEEYKTFVAYYDPRTGAFEYLDTWHRELGSVSYSISVYDNYLYYVKRLSDTNNSLYRIPLSGGKPERVNQEEDFIIQFSICNDIIYYRTNAFTLKSMDMDGGNLKTIEENICVINTANNNYITISSINNNGYKVTLNGETFVDAVDSPVDTVLLDGCLWYTMTNKVNFGSFTDENGQLRSIVSDNGTEIFKYDITASTKTVYNCSFGYGVSKFYGLIDNYMLLGILNKEKYIELWLVNSADTNEHYRIYEK